MSIETLIHQVLNYSPESDPEFLRAVYEFAAVSLDGIEFAPGAPAVDHALGTAMILARLQLGQESIAAALLHDLFELTEVAPRTLKRRFGEETTRLVEAAARLSRISWGRLEKEKAAGLRRMFLAMVDDVRVVLILLAEQLYLMYSLSHFSDETRRQRSEESLHIFAPLADRLGIRSIKWELEDLALQVLQPERFRQISYNLDERRDIRERSIREFIGALEIGLEKAGIQAEIMGRPKHIYSIYAKMESTQREFREIYDVRAVRIIVQDVQDCYAALDVVHGQWPPIADEYDDYIAVPKPNLYRSLHTAVTGPGGKPLEVQIRTAEMHRTAEWGIAAHWRYKDKAVSDIGMEAKAAYLRGLLEWQKDVVPEQVQEAPGRPDVFEKDVFVLTPQGDILALPRGATPLDFAYRIHTQVGHRCRGAKVNGKMVSLDHNLTNGDRVEIVTGKKESPSRDWLNPRLGFVKTPRARRDIRQWFLGQEREEFIARGRELVNRTLKRLGERIRDYDRAAAPFGFDRTDDFLEAVGRGQLSADHMRNRLAGATERGPILDLLESEPLRVSPSGVKVRGLVDLLTRVAQCCNPLPGEEIMGYITQGRGITIHRRDCHNILRQPDRDRLVDVAWGEDSQGYTVPIQVVGSGAQKLLQEVARIVDEENAKLLGTHVSTSPSDRLQTLLATLEIGSAIQIKKILQRIKGMPMVTEARRLL